MRQVEVILEDDLPLFDLDCVRKNVFAWQLRIGEARGGADIVAAGAIEGEGRRNA